MRPTLKECLLLTFFLSGAMLGQSLPPAQGQSGMASTFVRQFSGDAHCANAACAGCGLVQTQARSVGDFGQLAYTSRRMELV